MNEVETQQTEALRILVPIPMVQAGRFRATDARKQDGKLKMGDGCQPAQVSVS